MHDINRARSQRDKAEAQNQILRERNAALTQQLADASNLRAQLNFTKESTNFGLAGYRKVAADVQGRSPGLYNSRITISAGSADGVRKNDAVVTGPGWLVGHTGQVSAHESEVVLINDPGSQVSASVPAENAAGIVKPSAGNRNVLVLDYVSKARRVETGEVVVTTGLERRRDGAPLDLSARPGDRQRDELGRDRHGPVSRDPGDAVGRPPELLDRHGVRAEEPGKRRRVRILGPLRSLVISLLALWIAVLFAASLSANTTLFGGSPDLVVVVVVSLALLRGPEVGALAGFGAGLAVDALTWQPLGLAALVYCVVGYGAGRVGERVSDHAPVSPLVVVAIASLVARAGLVLLSFLLGSELAVPVGVTLGALPSAALDVLLAIPLYALLRRGLRGPPPAPSPLPHMSVPAPSNESDDVPAVLA